MSDESFEIRQVGERIESAGCVVAIAIALLAIAVFALGW
jgi:hypothetical protein